MTNQQRRPRASTINNPNNIVNGLRNSSIGENGGQLRSDSRGRNQVEEELEEDRSSNNVPSVINDRVSGNGIGGKADSVSRQALARFEDEDWKEGVDGVVGVSASATPTYSKLQIQEAIRNALKVRRFEK
jgi:hypothetical protein